jgi:DNA polymerase
MDSAPTPATNANDLACLARDAAGLLRFQAELGLTGLELPANVLVKTPAHRAAAPAASNAAVAKAAADTRAATPVTDPELKAVREALGDCQRCGLCQQRHTLVFGEGNAKARLVFVNGAPSASDDAQGHVLTGEPGALFDKMLAAMGLARADVYLTNVVKCRPPADREPHAAEVAICLPFLRRELALIKPAVVVTLGRTATKAVLNTDANVAELRGRFQNWNGIALLPTFHPAILLQHPEHKRAAWADLQEVMRRLGLAVPKTR